MYLFYSIKKYGIHFIGWVGYFLWIFNWYNSSVFSVSISTWIAIRQVFLHVLLFYLNKEVLLPNLFDQNRYLSYLGIIIATTIAVYYVEYFTNPILINPDELGFGMRTPKTSSLPGISRMIWNNVVTSSAVLFISTTVWLAEESRKKKELELEVQAEKLSSEMKFLKSQINPHFLFNALNNIYSFSLKNSPIASESIMKLSEMLRYVLYESNIDKVALHKEITYLKHFIGFQRIKFESAPDIRLDIDISEEDILIEPMLLIPFVENSFKHSQINETQGWIAITLKANKEIIQFTVENSIPEENFTKDAVGGIGLSNIEKRLKLLYPEKHQLLIEEETHRYKITLEIDLL